jgi:hypothetical protein
MNMIKIALTGATLLGLVVAGTAAKAEQIRSGAALPGVVSAKKIKVQRTAAPAQRESRSASGTDIGLGILAAGAGGAGGYFATRGNGDS